MVFSSIPVYLDPPNWHQQPNHHHHPLGTVAAIGSENPHELLPLAPPPTLPHVGSGGSGTGVGVGQAASIRPNSMSDRARLAKIPQPETALKCPRCESTNTKFCYFNNYSLSQPRHFCKTCRRYWTRGGALRNVPVGGGCRRNKKSKSNNNNSSSSSRSKSPVANNSTADHIQPGPNSITNHSSSDHHRMISPTHHLSQQLPLLAQSIQSLSRYSGASNMGLNFMNDIHQGQPSDHHNMGFQFHQIGGNNNLSGGILGADHNQWRNLNLQQIPFMGGTEFDSSSATGMYPFHQSGQGMDHHQESSDPMAGNNSRVNTDGQLPPPVKVEDNHGLRSARPNSLGTSTAGNNISENNNSQFWGGNLNAWTDLSGLNSSSTSHLL